MEQFSLEKYLENPSRKVVTRQGNSVRIICTDRKQYGENNFQIVFLEEYSGDEFLLACRKDGRSDDYDTPYDLFFADETEELTNFEKTVQNILNEPHFQDIESVKQFSKTLLDLARKEILKARIKETGEIVDLAQEVRGRKGESFQWFQLELIPELFDEFFDWKSFRSEVAKDILCATLSGGTAFGMIGIIPEKETIVKASIEIADELIKQLKEKEEK